jgi:hypothetical protein
MVLLHDGHEVAPKVVAVKVLFPEHVGPIRAFKVDEPAQAVELRFGDAKLALDVALALYDEA